ncbi:MAG: glycosyltransferase [Homoserinimonas sp.]|nr:glycosyltransferase [Homoserinimonas sp.]
MITVVSRIFLPEPSAASYRLGALVRGLSASGWQVNVITSAPPRGFSKDEIAIKNVKINRRWVLRDKDGYLRGYLNYLSFDIPAFFRLLFTRRPWAVVVEPPPTTGLIVRFVCGIRRIPYVYYAADLWADAVLSTGSPGFVAKWLRRVERWSLRGASIVLSVSGELTERVVELYGIESLTVGNGVDISSFEPTGESMRGGNPYFLYAGTASEVHGAMIFVEGFEKIQEDFPEAKLLFIGHGSDRKEIERRSQEVGNGAIEFRSRMSPDEVAKWIRGAVATLASVRPDGYFRAFPTKMYASIACGTPVIYAGIGPGRKFLKSASLGWGVDYDPAQVATAMELALATPPSEIERERLASWAAENVSLDVVAKRAIAAIDSMNRTENVRA